MNKVFSLVLICLLAIGCNKEKSVVATVFSDPIVTDYYFIETTPPLPHEELPSTKVSKLPEYENDSIAFHKGLEKAKIMHDKLVNACKETMERAEKYNSEYMIQAAKEANANMLSTSYTMLKLSHKKSFKSEDLINLIKKHGLLSDEAQEYTKNKQIEYQIWPLM